MPFAHWFELGEPVAGAPGIRAVEVDASAWRSVAQDVAAGGGRLLALWGDTSLAGPRQRSRAVRRAAGWTRRRVARVDGDRALSGNRGRLSVGGSAAASGLRPAWPAINRPGRAAVAASRRVARAVSSVGGGVRPAGSRIACCRGRLPFRARRRRRRARGAGRAGACGHHRARPLPLLDRRRKGAASRGASRLRAQGYRAALPVAEAEGRASSRGPRVR